MNQRDSVPRPGVLTALPRRCTHGPSEARALPRPVAGSMANIDCLAKPSIARVYDYLLGGKDNFSFDRDVAHRLIELLPGAASIVRSNRDFVERVVRHLAGVHGIWQFIDIGCGLPTQRNVHQIVQEIVPRARVVYVDNDPLVLSHLRALLALPGRVAVVAGDLRDPDGFLHGEETRRLIDFTKPVAVLLAGVLDFLGADDDPYRIVGQVRDAMTAGGHLAISHVVARPETVRCARELGLATGFGRTKDEIAAFFDGFDEEPPGLVPASRWYSGADAGDEQDAWIYAGLGRTRLCPFGGRA